MRKIDHDFILGKYSPEDYDAYIEATGAKPPALLGKTRRERKRWTAQDARAVTAFSEFLKHAGPPPSMADEILATAEPTSPTPIQKKSALSVEAEEQP